MRGGLTVEATATNTSVQGGNAPFVPGSVPVAAPIATRCCGVASPQGVNPSGLARPILHGQAVFDVTGSPDRVAFSGDGRDIRVTLPASRVRRRRTDHGVQPPSDHGAAQPAMVAPTAPALAAALAPASGSQGTLPPAAGSQGTPLAAAPPAPASSTAPASTPATASQAPAAASQAPASTPAPASQAPAMSTAAPAPASGSQGTPLTAPTTTVVPAPGA